MKFYQASNNGVVAIISEEHAKLYGVLKGAGGDPIVAGCRVFTFCRKKRMESGVAERMTFTGTHEDLEQLLKAGNHEIVHGSGGWDGYVPFSNGIQYGYSLGGHIQRDNDRMWNNELRYVTTLGDVMDVFQNIVNV